MKDDLVLNNINLIYMVLKQMDLYDRSDDFYDVGLIGLVKAANTYDASKGYTFTTYATTLIKNQIRLEIRRDNSSKRKANVNALSLDAPIYINENGDKIALIDSIPSNFNIETYLIEKEQLSEVRQAISKLNAREQLLLVYYYDGMNQKDIAKIFHVSQAWVSRMIKSIIRKIQKELNIEGNK